MVWSTVDRIAKNAQDRAENESPRSPRLERNRSSQRRLPLLLAPAAFLLQLRLNQAELCTQLLDIPSKRRVLLVDLVFQPARVLFKRVNPTFERSAWPLPCSTARPQRCRGSQLRTPSFHGLIARAPRELPQPCSCPSHKNRLAQLAVLDSSQLAGYEEKPCNLEYPARNGQTGTAHPCDTTCWAGVTLKPGRRLLCFMCDAASDSRAMRSEPRDGQGRWRSRYSRHRRAA